MEYDKDRVDEMVLALLWLTSFEDRADGARAWKGHDRDALDRLFQKGLISDPKSGPKSVAFTAEGFERSRELFEQTFGIAERRLHAR
jgi:hypothetical protein